MDELEQKLAQLEIEELFEEHINLKNLIGNKVGRDIANFYIQQYYNDKIAGKNPKIKPILITGKEGVSTFARAVHNNFGNLQFHGWIGFNDGETHNINYLTSDNVRVDYLISPGIQTTVNVLNGGGIVSPTPLEYYCGIFEGYNNSKSTADVKKY